jgi:hypothetical protein
LRGTVLIFRLLVYPMRVIQNISSSPNIRSICIRYSIRCVSCQSEMFPNVLEKISLSHMCSHDYLLFVGLDCLSSVPLDSLTSHVGKWKHFDFFVNRVAHYAIVLSWSNVIMHPVQNYVSYGLVGQLNIQVPYMK